MLPAGRNVRCTRVASSMLSRLGPQTQHSHSGCSSERQNTTLWQIFLLVMPSSPSLALRFRFWVCWQAVRMDRHSAGAPIGQSSLFPVDAPMADPIQDCMERLTPAELFARLFLFLCRHQNRAVKRCKISHMQTAHAVKARPHSTILSLLIKDGASGCRCVQRPANLLRPLLIR